MDDVTPQTEDTAPGANETLITRSVASVSRSGSNRSSVATAAAKARAKALAARARTVFVEKENKLMLERAQIDAHIKELNLNKDIAAAEAEADALEQLERSSRHSGGSRGSGIAALPSQSAYERTSEYVECHSKASNEVNVIEQRLFSENDFPDSVHLQRHVSSAAFNNAYQQQSSAIFNSALQQHSSAVLNSAPQQHSSAAFNSAPQKQSSAAFNNASRQHNPAVVNSTPQQRNPAVAKSSPKEQTNPFYSARNEQAPYTLSGDHTGFGDIAKFLARRELLSSSLTKFDDRPEGYGAWKSSFQNSIQGTGLSSSEELDLLTKWLGPQSSAHVKRIRAVHVNDPAVGLRKAWSRLQECYGSPEMVEMAFLNRLEKFPKITNKDPQKLRELGDLLQEIVSASHMGDLPGLTYLDTAKGLNPIVEKLPFNLQEKWISQGSDYKLRYNAQFPPFTFFADFVSREAYIRNDPSFTLFSSAATPAKPDNAVKKMSSSKT